MENKKIKILFIVNNWLSDFGGGKKMMSRVFNNLDFNKYKISFLSFEIGTKKQNFDKNLIALNSQIKFIPIFGFSVFRFKILKSFLVFFILAKIIRKEKPQIVFIPADHHLKAWSFFVIKIFSASTKIIFNDHNPHPPFLRYRSFIQKVVYLIIDKTLVKIAYSKVDKVIFVSQGLMEATKNLYNLKDKKICVIYNPVFSNDILEKAQESIEHPWFRENIPIILSVGRIESIQKDFTTLLKAFAKVREKMKARLVILGTGPQRGKLESLAKNLNIKNDTCFLGFQENPYKFMEESDVFVLSSKYEGFGVVLVEAMICGIPVISSDCKFGPREILQDEKNGILVPPGDVNALAESIILILNNKKLAQDFVQRGKIRVLDFTVEKSIAEYKKVLSEILKF